MSAGASRCAPIQVQLFVSLAGSALGIAVAFLPDRATDGLSSLLEKLLWDRSIVLGLCLALGVLDTRLEYIRVGRA